MSIVLKTVLLSPKIYCVSESSKTTLNSTQSHSSIKHLACFNCFDDILTKMSFFNNLKNRYTHYNSSTQMDS